MESLNESSDKNDFIVRLEKAASMLLKLLHESTRFDALLSTVSAVCQVAQFLYHDHELQQICSTQAKVKDKAIQITIPVRTKPNKKKMAQSKKLQSATKRNRKAGTNNRKRKKGQKQAKNKENKESEGRKGQSNPGGGRKVTHRKAKYKRKSAPSRHIDTSSESDELNNKKQEGNYNENAVTNSEEELDEKYQLQDIGKSDITPTVKPETLSEFQCSYCYKEFIDRRNLKSHLWVHEREKSFQCEVCHKLFLRSHQLTRHRRVHTGEKPYPCPVCGKAFADVSNLNTHKRKEHPNHTSVARCMECGKECLSTKDLQVHLRSHEEVQVKEDPSMGLTAIVKDGKGQPASNLALKLRLQKVRAAKAKLQRDREAFLCQICGKSLNKRAALLAHMKRHIRKKGYRCEYCNKVFTELRDLKVHLHIHTGERPYKCEECGKGFKSQGTLRSHQGVHSGIQRYSCDVCGRAFSQTSGLNLHKLKHTAEEERTLGSSAGPNQHSCEICGRCYKTKFRLQLHRKSHDSKLDVSCDFCDKKFQSSQDLAIHRRSHTKDKYLCRVCGASFKSRSVYYFHTKTHEIDRPHLCSVCGKSFVSANDLNAHKRRHTLGHTSKKSHDRFICNVCGRIYQMKNSLTIHMKIHQGIFDHPCDFCEKKFKSHAELRHHRRVHTQEKPYVCETCQRCFSRHSTLVNHRRTHSGERPYLCMICGAAFKLSCTLKKHAKIHTREMVEGKTRSGRNKPQRAAPPPPPQELQIQQPQPQQLQQDQLQHHHQHLQLQQLPPLSLSIAVPEIIAKPPTMLVDPGSQAHFIHELKPAENSIIQGDNSGLLHDRSNASFLLDPRSTSATMLQQQLREPLPNELDERETARNLIEIRNAVPNSVQYNPTNNTFTTTYYYY